MHSAGSLATVYAVYQSRINSTGGCTCRTRGRSYSIGRINSTSWGAPAQHRRQSFSLARITAPEGLHLNILRQHLHSPLCAGSMFTPMSIPGSAKYSSTGNFNPQLFRRMNLPDEVKISLAELGNFGVAKSTWSTYKSVERLLLKCQADCKTKFDWPLRTENVLLFIHWLVTIRGVKGGTVSSYLSGI
jgi:hypothetical protein